ncbi:MAG: YraN family protein [Proteobacteria bacterium]|nr:YraN family protein [Pseudomonadota bacterium]
MKKNQSATGYAQGIYAEEQALKYLKELGMVCIATRLKTPYGEIDLLMLDGLTIVAVEVKYRKSLTQAAYSIRPRQQLRIQQALEFWISQHKDYSISPPFQRFDVVLVCATEIISYYKNAWLPEVSY